MSPTNQSQLLQIERRRLFLDPHRQVLFTAPTGGRIPDDQHGVGLVRDQFVAVDLEKYVDTPISNVISFDT